MSEFRRPKSKEDLNQSFGQIHPPMDATMAYYESSRCLFCYDAPCIQACPTGIDIPLFIRQIQSNNVTGAAQTIYNANYFGHACGKVCPTEVLCEGACVYNSGDVKPIEIGRLQSFATSHVISRDIRLFRKGRKKNKKVAVIGAGPSGIACACELKKLGYQVTVFEKNEMPSGLTIYGVAPYKITNEETLAEVDYLQRQLGFDIEYNKVISKQKHFRKLEEEYDAIFLGIGLGPTSQIGIKGEDLKNSVGAVEFIKEVKTDPLQVDVGRKVVVIGGGNTSMDAASEAARLGADEVLVVYRRSRDEMRAYDFEYELAKSVGVTGLFNLSPIRIFGNGKVEGVIFAPTKMKQGNLKVLSKKRVTIYCDMVIRATGQDKFSFLRKSINHLEVNENGTIAVNEDSLQTTNHKYFAGGDAVNGGKEVVHAVADGKKAALGIHRSLSNK